MSSNINRTLTRNGRLIMTRLTTVEEQGDRSFDLEFWQQLSSEQRATAVWELAVDAWQMKGGGNPDELRLQRSVETLRRGRG
jgi:hypothetical protein